MDEYYDSTGKRQNSAPTDQGAFLEHPGYFDNRLFNISPREALQMDPVHRMLLTTSWEALEMAGYSRDATPSTRSNRIATYFGQTSDEWRDVLNTKDIDIYYVPGAGRCFAPARLAHHYKWGGGTYALETGCSTSITAIHLACQALTSRECDTALAGGGSICISPTIFEAMCKCGMVSSRGGCRTFHDDADGYVRGEGIGVVVLKRLEDAMADNDNVLGVIRGHARTHQSASVSITNPSAESQSSLFQDVLWQTATEPGEIAYVELHGTGTQAGDVAEMTSVVQVLGQQRSKKNVLTVGAVKANVGHGEATAGVTALIKVLMMMKQRKIAPQPGLPFKINRKLPNLGPLHVRIAGTGSDDNLTLRPSPASADGKIKCMINSFDSAGGSTALLVEEPPKRPGKTDNPLPCHIVALSARTLTSLQQNRKRLLDYLIRSPETKLADLAYTTTARRMHEVLRVAYTGRSTKEVVEKLIKDVSLEAQNDPKKKAPPMSVVFAFTGQGSPYVGMGRQLYQHNTALRGWLHSYQQVAEHQGLPRFLHIISDDNADLTASSVIVQLALVALEIATARLLRAWGVKPNMIIGHSLGEYSALCVAGVLSVSDTLYLVGQRAQLMERKLVSGEYAMLAIDRGPDAAQQLLAAEAAALSSRTEIACVNAPDATVISGPISEVEHVKSVLEKEGSRSKVLQTQYGFHSHHVDAIIFDFKAIAKRASFSAPETPIASTSLGRVIEAGTHDVFSPDYLAQHARERVNFAGAVQAYQAHSLAKSRTAWIEIGPEPVCIGLARRTLKVSSDLFLPTIKATENNWVTVSSALASLYQAGVTINWVAYHSCFASSLSLLPLPTYAFDEKNYWTPYVKSVHLAHPLPQADEIRKGSDLNTPPSFSTTSLQLLEKESVEQDSVSVTFASRTSEHGLCEAIKGHVVNGVPVASLSILYDMAKSAATYAYRKLHPAQKMPSMTICNVDLKQAIILSKDGHEQIIKTKVSLSGSTNAFVSFSSVQGAVCAEHGSMRVAFEDVSTWFGQQSQMSLLVDARIQALKDNASMGIAHRLMKPAVYRLFDNVVSYGKNYQAMEEVWLDAECRDAAGIIKLPKITAAGNFLHNPFWADGATHIAGFLVNCGLKYDQDVACFCPAVESWHVLEELRADEVYTAYTTVQDTTANVLSGSVYVYDSKRKLVQVLSGICFRKTTKIALGEVLATRPTPTALSAMPTSVERSMLPRLEPPDSNVTVSSSATDVGDDSDIDQDKLGVITISGGSSTAQSLFSIILSECGLSEAEIEPSTAFHDLGLDSLMAITILSTFRMKTEIELPPTFFMDHQTVAEAREALLVS